MATRATVTVFKNRKYHTIYTHWDGYPSHHGPLLLNFYGSQEAAEALIALGNCSTLSETIEPLPNGWTFDNRPSPDNKQAYTEYSRYCVFYGRDRGEEKQNAQVFSTWKQSVKYMGEEYNYLWKDGKWHMGMDAKGNPVELTPDRIKKYS